MAAYTSWSHLDSRCFGARSASSTSRTGPFSCSPHSASRRVSSSGAQRWLCGRVPRRSSARRAPRCWAGGFAVPPRLSLGRVGQLLVSFGLVLVLNNVTRLVFGTQPLSMSPPRPLAGYIELGSFRLATYQVAVLAVTAVVAIYLWAVLTRSRTGRLIRARSTIPDARGGGRRRATAANQRDGHRGAACCHRGAITVPRGAINTDWTFRLSSSPLLWSWWVGSAQSGRSRRRHADRVAETVSTLFIDQGGEVIIFASWCSFC